MNTDKTLWVPRYISNGMIVQQNDPLVIKGKDVPGTQVTICFDSEKVVTVADASGLWAETLSPRRAGGPYTLHITGTSRKVIRDVYVGEVWLLGGQSNMELPVNRTYDEFKEEIDAADYPLIRQFHLELDPVFDKPKEWLEQGKWKTATQENIQDFSSLGFFYAKKLHEELSVPIGIYHTAVGGTPIEAWISEETLHELGDYDEEMDYWRDPEIVEKEIQKDLKINQEWYEDLDEHDRGLQDSQKWMEEDLDTANWVPLELPAMFKDTDLAEFSGVIWFRKTFEVKEEHLESERLRLRLGSLINGDETYLNGKKVGATSYRYPPRKYVLDKKDLKVGTNTLVVRLMIDAANGGFIPNVPYQIELDKETISLEGEWLYRIGYQKELIAPMLFLHYKPAALYKGMLYPSKDIAFKGFLFYQGESNSKQPLGYKELMKRLVQDWRNLFKEDLPFYYVQLANYVDPAVGSDDKKWAELRYEQDRARFMIDNSEMIPALDCGLSYELHPHDKKTLAHRLARVALSRDYQLGEAYANLEIRDISKSKKAVTLKVKGLQGELALTEEMLEIELKLAGQWRKAEITSTNNDEIKCALFESVDLSNVTEVRYAWRNNPQGYVFDTKTNLPLLPFTYPF
ncbi:sialate O-acetylesterase [Alkalibacterium sp. f15]|uniref:sialate O-acetylesterase n=1 Tax=Alkalibacterium sp. f15 TaxID=3414029 RepID=UPI003BF79EF9